jgi:protein-S-isoprenylcysteine O-methyltransferase Ste14
MERSNEETRKGNQLMDPLNIIAGINLIATFGANLGGAKKGLKSVITDAKEKPQSYLQKFPLMLSVLVLVAFILGIFGIGTLNYTNENIALRGAGLGLYLLFSWIQIYAVKNLGDFYSQDIVVFKQHQLVTKGAFKTLRHPQYVSEIIMNAGACLLTLSIPVLILVIIQIPFLILRAMLEERLLTKYFEPEYAAYKKRSGFFIPFIG